MKKVLKNVKLRQSSAQVFVFLLLKMSFIFGQETSARKIIVIDPGHGGKDSGAIGINGIQEKDVVLRIAKEIVALNRNLKKPVDIYLTRYDDTLISLSDRPNLAKKLETDFFISLHCNHSDNPNARGIEVYVDGTKSGYSKESTWLAFQLQAAFKKKLDFESRGVKFANFQVMREMVDYCPAVLVEVGFLTNEDEGFYFLQPSKVKAVAMAILMGIENYLKTKL